MRNGPAQAYSNHGSNNRATLLSPAGESKLTEKKLGGF